MNQYDDERLTSELKGRASDIGDYSHPLSFEDVKAKAGSIRRRRIAVATVAAAALVAVAVPAGIAGTNVFNGNKETPPANTSVNPTVDQSDTTNPNTDEPPTSADENTAQHVVLTTSGLAQSDNLPETYLYNGKLVIPDDAGTVDLGPGKYFDVAPFDINYLAIKSDPDTGESTIAQYDLAGNVIGDPIPVLSNTIARSDDFSLAAFTGSDGAIYLWRAGQAQPEKWIEARSADEPITPITVAGENGSCVDPEGDQPGTGCTIFYNVDGANPSSRYATSHGIEDALPFAKLSDVNLDGKGLLDGVTSFNADGSACSAMYTGSFKKLYETCDYVLGAISPDGKYVIGEPAYQSGTGDSSISILDAQTGDPIVEYEAAKNANTFVHSSIWSLHGTVDALVWDKDHWADIELDTEGNATMLVSDIASPDDFDPLFVFGH